VPDLCNTFILTADVIDRLSRCDAVVNQAQVTDVSGAEDNRDDVNDDVAVLSSPVANDDVTVMVDQNDVECDNVNEDCDDVTDGGGVPTSDRSLSSSSEVAQEQRDDATLTGCWKLADKGRAGFVVKDNLLYHRTKILGQDVYQLVVPESRRAQVLKMGHDSFGGHMGFKHTKARIGYTFYWSGLREDCEQNVKTCEACQMKVRVTYRDRVAIKPVPRADRVYDHRFIDCAGPFFITEGQKVKCNYAFIAIDSFSRFPVCYAMRSLTAKNVCGALLVAVHRLLLIYFI